MSKQYDLIIIGSGPAGLSAAVYAGRAKLNTLVIEKAPMSGGQVLNTYEVDNYLGMPGSNGFDMGMKFREHAESMGAEFIAATVERVEDKQEYKQIFTDNGIVEGKAVILATGASHRKLEIPGELELSGKGVSYCATCDGAFFRGKVTAVIGGGDVAVEDAVFLARMCKKVYVIHRRDSFRAAKMLSERLLALDNAEVLWDSVAEEIRGEEHVEEITVKNVKTGEITQLPVDGVFVAVGIIPEVSGFEGLVRQDEAGYLAAGEDCKTSIPGIFAAGDVRTKRLRQIVTAVADGANAVTSAEEYLLSMKV